MWHEKGENQTTNRKKWESTKNKWETCEPESFAEDLQLFEDWGNVVDGETNHARRRGVQTKRLCFIHETERWQESKKKKQFSNMYNKKSKQLMRKIGDQKEDIEK